MSLPTDTPSSPQGSTHKRVLSISLTEQGRTRAGQLPYEHVHGDLGDTVRARWSEVDALVLFCATGIAVRVIAPLLGTGADAKVVDPAVITIDEAGRFVVALAGGHGGGANDLAREVAERLGAEPVITTATDAIDSFALDTLPGVVASGDIAGVTRAMLDGECATVEVEVGVAATPAEDSPWVPAGMQGGDGPSRIVVTDRLAPIQTDGDAPITLLHPPSLVVGVGASSNAPAEAARELLDQALADHGLSEHSIAAVATIDRRAPDPVVTSLGLAIRSFTGPELAPVTVPNPSEVVAAEVGTASVAEAAALLAAGPGAELVVEKIKGETATVAIARRAQPEGSVTVVGLGPGDARHRTPEATASIRSAEVVIGYKLYVEQCASLTRAGQVVIESPIGAEVDRCAEAVRRAAAGQRVTLVCSGDSGVFAMATLVLEVAPKFGNPPVHVVPGVTASLAAASILGAPLAHDHALISLSDLLTPWEVIERRLVAVAEADMAVAFYNPRSQRRITQLARAREILSEHRPPETPVGIVVNATRPGQQVLVTTLAELDPADVDMFSIVVVGSSTTVLSNGFLVTPRGYDAEEPAASVGATR